MDERELSLAVVGIGYPNPDGSNRQFEVALCSPGDPVELRREPKHPADEYAVAVFSERGVRMGYIPSERAAFIAGRMDAGEQITAVFQGMGSSAAWVRARFGKQAPALPTQRPRAPTIRSAAAFDPDTDADWQPDPEGSEWGA